MKKNLLYLIVNLIFIISSLCSNAQTPYGGTAHTIPGKIEAKDFDEGGEGVAYHDVDATNNGGGYRTNEGVDIHTVGTIGWFKDGEWLLYTVDVEEGTYDIVLGVGTQYDGRMMGIYLDDSLISAHPINNTGSWDLVPDTIHGIDLPGGTNKQLRILNVGDDFDFYWLEFIKTSATSTKQVATENLKCFPSPVSDELTIQNVTKGSRISVFNIAGSNVLNIYSTTDGQVHIDMKTFKPGIYLLRIEDNLSVVRNFKITKK